MATWNSRGLRGSGLENLVNHTNEYYRRNRLALVQKIPTPIVPVRFEKSTHRITDAYFEKDSTVDYIGVVQGIPVCFDAKESKTDTFELRNIHPHQIHFMQEFEDQGGISFILLHFTMRNDFYYMTFRELTGFLERVQEGHPNNLKYLELRDEYFLHQKEGALVPYLQGIERDLLERDGKE
ncbi:MAG: Holliday junction resolvase RecU [Eubacterium sp.]|nr:Holliday junction resolvase RecU [Eubacterium sp.]MBR6173601.1 Holliday junction resolvase RecU [Eubacterium sp.]